MANAEVPSAKPKKRDYRSGVDYDRRITLRPPLAAGLPTSNGQFAVHCTLLQNNLMSSSFKTTFCDVLSQLNVHFGSTTKHIIISS